MCVVSSGLRSSDRFIELAHTSDAITVTTCWQSLEAATGANATSSLQLARATPPTPQRRSRTARAPDMRAAEAILRLANEGQARRQSHKCRSPTQAEETARKANRILIAPMEWDLAQTKSSRQRAA